VPLNVELKARLADRPATEALLATISDTPPTTLRQRDTFFRCHHGRLKLRELDAGGGELIAYDRANLTGARESDYAIAAVADAAALHAVLSRTLGATTVVEKTRVLYRVGQTRVHVDEVAGLGDFLELEVVMRADQSPDEGRAIAVDLMRRLGIREGDLVAMAYADLLAERAARR